MTSQNEKCGIFDLLEAEDICQYVKETCIQNNFINIYELYFCDLYAKKVK
jgi:hypothetical protein